MYLVLFWFWHLYFGLKPCVLPKYKSWSTKLASWYAIEAYRESTSKIMKMGQIGPCQPRAYPVSGSSASLTLKIRWNLSAWLFKLKVEIHVVLFVVRTKKCKMLSWVFIFSFENGHFSGEKVKSLSDKLGIKGLS